jgi:ABC-type transporter Mla subunit MlaD
VVQRAQKLLNDDNLNAVSAALGNFHRASSNLPDTLHNLNVLINDLRSASAELSASAHSARDMLDSVDPDVRAATKQLHTIADHLEDASGQLDKVIAENRKDIRSFTRDGLPEIERFVREGRAAAQDIRALSSSLRENPAQLIYQPPDRGVEIAK